MGIECCSELDLKLTKYGFKSWVILDPCDYIFSVGFERISFNKTLLNYNWGVWDERAIGSALAIKYRLNKDSVRKIFIVDLQLSFELDGTPTDLDIFKGYEVPQLFCNQNATLGLPDIKDIASVAAESALGILLQRLGLSPNFFRGEACMLPNSTALAPLSHKNCPHLQLPTGLPSNIKCHIKGNCLGIECCLDLKIISLQYSFKSWLILDPCNLTISIGFENWHWEKTIFDNWDTIIEQDLGSAIKLRFKFSKTPENSLLVYMGVKVCIEGTCSTDIVLLNNAVVPIPFCTSGNLTWPSINLSNIAASAFDAGTGIILNRLGIDPNLLTGGQCMHSTATAVAAQAKCPLFTLPALPSNVNCSLSDKCLGIDCCVNVDFKIVQRAFRAWINLDPCTFEFEAGFENFKINRSLIGYNWGIEQDVSLGKALKIKYKIDRSQDLQNFLVTLGVQICVDSYCDINIYVMRDTPMPIPLCNVNGTLSWPKIDWKDIAGQALDGVSGLVLTRLGLEPRFLRNQQCDPSTELSVVGNDTARCPYISLPAMPSNVHCSLSDKCTGIDCCVDLDLGIATRSFRAWVILDPCTLSLYLGFENWHHNITLISNWGVEQKILIGNALQIRYTLGQTPDLMNFIMSLGVDLTLDGTTIPLDILHQVVMPIPGCSPNGTLVWPSIEFNGIAGSAVAGVSGLLMNRLGIDPAFLRSEQCLQPNSTALATCPYFSLPALPPQVRCTVASSCLGVECCVDLDLKVVSRSFKTWAIIDPCKFTISIGFENWYINASLLEYDWGATKRDKIGSAIVLDYKIDKTADGKNFIFDLAVSLCFDPTLCSESFELLKKAIMPIPLCNLNGSLSWPSVNMTNIGNKLFEAATSMALQKLGLDRSFLQGSECTNPTALVPVSNRNCPRFNLPTNMPSFVQCNVYDTCLGVQCCLNLKLLSLERLFKAWMEFDPCELRLSIGFENWSFNKTIFDAWGVPHEEWIGNSLKMIYKVDKTMDNQLLVDLGVQVCLHGSCTTDIVIFHNAAVSIPFCGNGTLTWPVLDTNGIIQSTVDAATGLVLNRLGIDSSFLRGPACAFDTALATSRDASCPHFNAPSLPSNIHCMLSDKCLGIECCVDVDFKLAKWSFNTWVVLDPCTFRFSAGIENMYFNRSLTAGFPWGVEQQEPIGKAITIKYKIARSPDLENFLITIGVQMCVDNYCDINVYIMKDSPMPIPMCSTNGTLAWPSVNLHNLAGQALEGVSGLIVTRLGLDPLDLRSEPCTAPLVDPNNGTCPHFTMPAPPTGVKCFLSEKCTGIECCVDLDLKLASRSFKAWIMLDPCSFEFSMGFEKWMFNRSLGNYIFGKTQTEKIGSALTFTFKIDKSADLLNFVFDLDVQICLDGGCMPKVVILNGQIMPIPGCNADGTFAWPSITSIGGDAISGLLMNRLGLGSEFLSSSQCVRPTAVAAPVCPHFTMPTLPPNINCQINEYCMGLECCADLDLKIVSRSFKFWIIIDPCIFMMSFGIDRWSYNTSLLSYPWGVARTQPIGKALSVSYTIDKSTDEKNFIVSLSLDLCLDSVCTNFPFFNNDVMPIPGCSANGTLDWSLSAIGSSLADSATNLVLQKLGLPPNFLRPSSCVAPTAASPTSSVKCPSFTLPSYLPSNVHCSIVNECLGVECCLDLEILSLKKSFKSWLIVDPCNLEFAMGFENWYYNRSLLGYFGHRYEEKLGNSLKLVFGYNKTTDGELVVDLGVKICYGGTCSTDIKILDSAVIPIPLCTNGTYVWPKVNLAGLGTNLLQTGAGLILNRLGLPPDLLSSQSCTAPPAALVTARDAQCPYFSLPALPSFAHCTLSDKCLGLECCIDVDFKLVQRSFKTWLTLDPWTFNFSLGFENWYFSKSLLYYDFGREEVANIGGGLSLRYIIDRTSDLQEFNVTLTLDLCNGDSCNVDIPLLVGAIMPVPLCNPNGSLSWPSVDFTGLGGKVNEGVSGLVLNRLGFDPKFLNSDSCDASAVTPSSCPHVSLPSLPMNATCTLSDACTGIECCLDLDLKVARRSFHTWLKLDPCTFEFSMGFERWTVNTSLLNFKFGKSHVVNLGSALKLTYSVDKSLELKNFIVDMAVDLCLDGVCFPQMVIFNKAAMAIPGCSANGTYIWPSVDTTSLSGALMEGVSGLLVNRLGIAPEFLRSSQCNVNTTLSTGACPYFHAPATLPSFVHCTPHERCLGMECCLDLDLEIVSRSFKAWAFVDPCKFDLSIGFERWSLNVSILGYPWGEEREGRVAQSIIMKYSVNNVDDMYIALSLSVQLCLYDGGATCGEPMQIMDHLEIPVPICNPNGTLAWPRYDLIEAGVFLDEASAIVLSRLGMSTDLLYGSSCFMDESVKLMTASKCAHLTLPTTPSNVHCAMTDGCTGIDCCLDLDLEITSRSFKSWLRLDPCTFGLSLGFERWSFNRTLLHYDFGKEHVEDVGSAVKFKFTISKSVDNRDFIINLKTLLCLDGTCLPDVIIFSGLVLPIPLCHVDGSFEWPGLGFGVSSVGTFPSSLIVNRLGVSLEDLHWSQCVPSASAASCPHLDLPDVVGANCSQSASCTGLDCCLDIDLDIARRSFYAWANIDPCSFTLSVGFENWVKEESLIGYNWGTKQEKQIGQALTIDYTIDKTSDDKNFIMDVGVKLCFDKTTVCDEEFRIFNNTLVPIPLCNMDGTYTWPKVGANTTSDLASGLVINRLNVTSDLLMATPCAFATYNVTPTPPAACASLYPTIYNRENVQCILNDDCYSVDCCIEMDLDIVNRTFAAWARLDPCADTYSLGLENWMINGTLSTLPVGKPSNIKVSSTMRVMYIIVPIPDMSSMPSGPPPAAGAKVKIAEFNVNMMVMFDLPDKEHAFMLLNETMMGGGNCTLEMGLSGMTPSGRRRRAINLPDLDASHTLKKHPRSSASAGARQATRQNRVSNLYQKTKDGLDQGMRSWYEKNPKKDSYTYDELKQSMKDEIDKNDGRPHRLDGDPWAKERPARDSTRSAPTPSMGLSVSVGPNSFFSALDGAAGVGSSLFAPGKGLTGLGAQRLGAALASMTIGDIETMLDLNNIDPIVAFQLMGELRELFQVIVEEAIDVIMDGGLNSDLFKSFDVSLTGTFSFPRQTINIFKYDYFMVVGGIVPMMFGFGANCYWGVDLQIGASLLSMKVTGGAVPYLGAQVYGYLRVGFLLWGELRLEGDLMTTRFPAAAEVGFSSFPLDVGLRLDIELIPLSVKLDALVILEIPLLFTTIRQVLFKFPLWAYQTPKITANILNLHTKNKDMSPPKITGFSTPMQTPAAQGKRSTPGIVLPDITTHCTVIQVPNRDEVEPAFQLELAAGDDRSEVKMTYSIGTMPGGSNVVDNAEFSGPSAVVAGPLPVYGVPLYFTVTVKNNQGDASLATCSIPSYDITLPGGRVTPNFKATSHPNILRASAVVFDDTPITSASEGVGFGKDIFGDQMVEWHPVEVNKRVHGVTLGPDPNGVRNLQLFTSPRIGRLNAKPFQTAKHMFPQRCAYDCLAYPPEKCLSFNFDYSGDYGICELMEEIEGHGFEVHESGSFNHFERLGVGHAVEFQHNNLGLEHNNLYYFNLEVTNELNFTDILSAEGIIADFTPPNPGPINITSEALTHESCEDLVPPEWRYRCIEETPLPNHKTLIDGEGSWTLFNGHEPMNDLKWTRANKFISANWDGIHDYESSIYGYTWSVGHSPCDEMLKEHHDPHRNLTEAEWTHTGFLQPLPAGYSPLPDGQYFITLRAINKVEFGGPIVLSVCHSTPYVIDNSPPFVYDVTNIRYDEDEELISADYNITDPHSGILEFEVGLGRSRHDTYLLPFQELQQPHMEDVGRLFHNAKVPDGIPAWLKIRAINNVNLRAVGTADRPILVDTTPPEAGTVYDGPHQRQDWNFTGQKYQACANWFDFHDKESGISYYLWAIGTCPGCNDVMDWFYLRHHVADFCINDGSVVFQHNVTYYSTIVGVNGGHAELNATASSDGMLCDLTYPEAGDVIDGVDNHFQDMKYTYHRGTVVAQWRNFKDPESDIKEFAVTVFRKHHDSENTTLNEYEIIHEEEVLDADTSSIIWHHFHLHHGDTVKTQLKTTNRARNAILDETDGFIVDLTAPSLQYIHDGLDANYEPDYQFNDTALSANWKFEDPESGLANHQVMMFETYHGTRQQIVPATPGTWQPVPGDSTATSHTESGLSLKPGAHYTTRVGATNGALLTTSYDTDSIVVDPSPPKMRWLHIGVVSGETEEEMDGYVWQADRAGIKATWFATDGESDIKAYWVAVGSNPFGEELLIFTNLGPKLNNRVTGFFLQLTDKRTELPVYYVTVKAENGAGSFSNPMTSTPIFVVDVDRTGYTTDGPYSTTVGGITTIVDTDYQKEIHTVTAQFAGFESQLYGLRHYEWAIGKSPHSDEVQPYMSAGIVLNDEPYINGGGLGGSGQAQAVLPLVPGVTYYTTIRAVTGEGKALEAVSDGFTVDVTAPKVEINSLGIVLENATVTYDNTEGTVHYQHRPDSVSATWEFNETESRMTYMTYKYGTYHGADDVYNTTVVNHTSGSWSSVPNGEVRPQLGGVPNILTISVMNSVGLWGRMTSGSVLVDTTPPEEGILTCPEFTQAVDSLECEWSGVFDAESGISHFIFGIGTAEDLDDMFAFTELPAYARKYMATGSSRRMIHGHKYYATLKIINNVAMETTIFSAAIVIDDTPPIYGSVIELSGVHEVDMTAASQINQMNPRVCNSDEECTKLDAVCQKSITKVTVAWQPFFDRETPLTKYQIAVGTSRGGTQVKEFFDVPLDARSYVIDGLDLAAIRQIFVSVKGYNAAGHFSTATSNGVYISRLSAGLRPLSPPMVYDGQNPRGDQDFQSSIEEINSWWDFSGDPCPVLQYEWAIERLDGLIIQNMTDTGTETNGVFSGLDLKNGEAYYTVVRATNALGYVHSIRSDGIVVQQEPLLPGRVNDGNVTGYDFNYQAPIDQLSANWDYFGDERKNVETAHSGNPGVAVGEIGIQQIVDYYEIAIGTDRRYAKTRDNIQPFTYVGLNKTWTFYDLRLLPRTGIYYVTIRAHSRGFASAEVTSNGIKVGYAGGVTAGTIKAHDYLNSDSEMRVSWLDFKGAELPMKMFYIGIGNITKLDHLKCNDLIEGGSLPDDELEKYFSIFNLINVREDTFRHITSLNMTHNTEYAITVIGVDEAAQCNMTTTTFTVDITDPVEGELRSGPYYNMKVSYAASAYRLGVTWKDYSDPESAILSYDLKLFTVTSCSLANPLSVLQEVAEAPDWIKLNASYSFYTFMDLDLKIETPYYIKLRTTNHAKTSIITITPPILLDISEPVGGAVIDGGDFMVDMTFHGFRNNITASILHHANPDGPSCPDRPAMLDAASWDTLTSQDLWNMEKSWDVMYRPQQVSFNSGTAAITLQRDVSTKRVYSGALYTQAEIVEGGTYKMRIQAAEGDHMITSINIWDGPDGTVGDFEELIEEDWTQAACACCYDPLTINSCHCNCTEFLAYKDYLANLNINSTDTTTTTLLPTTTPAAQIPTYYTVKKKPLPGDSYTGSEDEKEVAQKGCGVQLIPGSYPQALLWCRTYNDKYRTRSERVTLNFDPADGFHDYEVSISPEHIDPTREEWQIHLKVDGQLIATMAGLEQFSEKAKLLFHVWNRDNSIPEIVDPFHPFQTQALITDIRLPPDTSVLCRYGHPFRGGTNAIVAYEAAIGTEPGLENIQPYKEVIHPCAPCDKPCDQYSCSASCNKDEIVPFTFTLDGLHLSDQVSYTTENGTVAKKTAVYYVTVKAVLGSGSSVQVSSNGIILDTTPPVVDFIFYMDAASPNEFAPTQFQASNSTIKAYWRFEDDESAVREYRWAIGTYPGGTDLQDFITLGTNQTSVNTSFEGLLQNNVTYYVTVFAINGAGLETIYMDPLGVTVVLVAPDVTDINTTLPYAAPFTQLVYPPSAKQTSHQGEIGMTWTVSDDPAVNRYDYCVGSSEETYDDIVGCVQVGLNTSGSTTIKDGKLFIDGVAVANISELRTPEGNGTVDLSKNGFFLEPGRTLHTYLRVCNAASKCTTKYMDTVTIITADDHLEVSPDGRDVVYSSTTSPVGRKKRAASAQFDLSVATSGGLPKGGSIIVGLLDSTRVKEDYSSDISMDFKSYIVDPASTIGFTSRVLVNRIQNTLEPSFFVSTLAQLELSGPLLITTTFDPTADWSKNQPRLIYWDTANRMWSDAAQSCPTDDVSYDFTRGIMTTKVCSTSHQEREPGSRRKRTAAPSFFNKETQFAATVVTQAITNNAPEVLTPLNMTMTGPGANGILTTQLVAVDSEGDTPVFQINQSNQAHDLGKVTISPNGTLTFTPNPGMSGEQEIQILITDEPVAGSGVTPNSTLVTVKVTIPDSPDFPKVMFLSNGKDYVEKVTTTGNKTIEISIEQNTGHNIMYAPFLATVVGYDFDLGDTLLFTVEPPTRGTVTMGHSSHIKPSLPNVVAGREDFSRYATWSTATLAYQPDFDYHGNDEFRLLVEDKDGLYSDLVIVKVAVMKNPCVNNGTCQGPSTDRDCKDQTRAQSFDGYHCICPDGYSGPDCSQDFDECLSTPCEYPLECVDKINSFSCECPPSWPDCLGPETWVYGAAAGGAAVLLASIGIIVWLVLRRRKRGLANKVGPVSPAGKKPSEIPMKDFSDPPPTARSVRSTRSVNLSFGSPSTISPVSVDERPTGDSPRRPPPTLRGARQSFA